MLMWLLQQIWALQQPTLGYAVLLLAWHCSLKSELGSVTAFEHDMLEFEHLRPCQTGYREKSPRELPTFAYIYTWKAKTKKSLSENAVMINFFWVKSSFNCKNP